MTLSIVNKISIKPKLSEQFKDISSIVLLSKFDQPQYQQKLINMITTADHRNFTTSLRFSKYSLINLALIVNSFFRLGMMRKSPPEVSTTSDQANEGTFMICPFCA